MRSNKMMRSPLLYLILFFFAFHCNGQFPIDFSSSDNLKAVYDAGYRPWRVSPDSCNLDHVNITVILPGNARFSLQSEMAGFDALAGDQLSGAHFISEFMHTSEAEVKALAICKSLGVSTAGLDHAVASSVNPAKPQVWSGRTKKDEISVSLSLQFFTYVNPVECKINVILQWDRNGAPMKFSTKEIQPPAGYENVSMVPPKPLHQQGRPNHDFDYYKHLIRNAQAHSGNSPVPTDTP